MQHDEREDEGSDRENRDDRPKDEGQLGAFELGLGPRAGPSDRGILDGQQAADDGMRPVRPFARIERVGPAGDRRRIEVVAEWHELGEIVLLGRGHDLGHGFGHAVLDDRPDHFPGEIDLRVGGRHGGMLAVARWSASGDGTGQNGDGGTRLLARDPGELAQGAVRHQIAIGGGQPAQQVVAHRLARADHRRRRREPGLAELVRSRRPVALEGPVDLFPRHLEVGPAGAQLEALPGGEQVIEAGDTHRCQGRGEPLFGHLPGGREPGRRCRADGGQATEGEIGELPLLQKGSARGQEVGANAIDDGEIASALGFVPGLLREQGQGQQQGATEKDHEAGERRADAEAGHGRGAGQRASD